jgi:hypothetical protein
MEIVNWRGGSLVSLRINHVHLLWRGELRRWTENRNVGKKYVSRAVQDAIKYGLAAEDEIRTLQPYIWNPMVKNNWGDVATPYFSSQIFNAL